MTSLRYRVDKFIRPNLTRLHHPVFIVGCGRSGKTILGKVLGHHPQITYLNEPRKLWLHEPRTDIWSEAARQRHGQLCLTASDVIPENALKIRDAFAYEVYQQGTRRLVEKLPINSFRIGFIRATFHDAHFIHLIRNGLEVARSIERETQKYAWYAADDYKWRLLAAYADEQGLGHLVDLAADDMFLRGLLEWRLSVSTALNSLARLDDAEKITVRYEDLLQSPADEIRRLETFVEVEPNPQTHDLAQDTIQNAAPEVEMTPVMEEIAGNLLHQLGYIED